MIVTTSMHPEWLSNAYLVADHAGGHAVIVDAGAPIEPLLVAADELGVHVTHVLLTHEHHDHTTHMVELQERFDAQLVLPDSLTDRFTISSGDLRLRALPTPGHCDPHVTWVVEDEDRVAIAAFTGDALFHGTVGGTLNGGVDGFEHLRESILQRILALPATTTLYPGHVDATTVAEELATNPFVRAWRGDNPFVAEHVSVAGNDATLLLEAADYDGGTKAWVRFADGREAVVGGSMLSRAGARA